MTYRGRFAPSPTGPLHFGSLVAAVGSYLQAKQANGQWLVRIEDLDPPRTVPGSAEQILRTLQEFGFVWDEAVVYQSQRTATYQHALQKLIERDVAYACSCTRSELQALAARSLGDSEELPYPGRCRLKPLRAEPPHSWRFRVPMDAVGFIDQLQGEQRVYLQNSIGDFIIKRRDGWFAYQLAVVVDDAAQQITEVVRGADLLLATPRQLALQQALGLQTPHYLHLPLLVDAAGNKLAKSTAAPPVSAQFAASTLWQALTVLRQAPPDSLRSASLATVWSWAIDHWQLAPLRGLRQLRMGSPAN